MQVNNHVNNGDEKFWKLHILIKVDSTGERDKNLCRLETMKTSTVLSGSLNSLIWCSIQTSDSPLKKKRINRRLSTCT